MNQNQPTDPKVQATGFNFMSPATPTTQPTSQAPSAQAWSTPTTASASSGGFNLNAALSATKTPTTSSGLAKPATLTPSTPVSAPATTGFSFPATSKPASTTASPFAALAAKTTTTATSQPSSTTATTVATTLATSTSSAPTSAAPTLGTTGINLGAAKAPAPATTTQQPSLNFQQLEELILNKWTGELYEQEKVFYNQATQINLWDKVINENSEKLTQLHSTMEKVRKQQTKINDDLEVIATHQKDLEACLVPLEKEDLLAVLKGDPNRKNLYSNAKKIDSQIKSMAENLKETIEHINETSRSHDTEDPVIQVGRILNAHMESLRWIDEHTARMQDYFDSLLKVHDDLRRECDLTKH